MGIRIYRTPAGIILERAGRYYLLPSSDWDEFINTDGLYERAIRGVDDATPVADGPRLVDETALAPIGRQEVWAAGVTYYRSREARMEESQEAGGGSFYEHVYDADRPELFFKASAARTVGSGAAVRIRADSTWNVPEPELTLLVSSQGSIVGYTVGNDMSSRSIEGENPLYLPQAKVYDGSAALGPGIYVSDAPLQPETRIAIEISRAGAVTFKEEVAISQMKRTPEELVAYLFRACSFEHGCFLMTGTGIVPPDSFTLQPGDEIRITIDPIGTLVNVVG